MPIPYKSIYGKVTMPPKVGLEYLIRQFVHSLPKDVVDLATMKDPSQQRIHVAYTVKVRRSFSLDELAYYSASDQRAFLEMIFRQIIDDAKFLQKKVNTITPEPDEIQIEVSL